MYKKVVSVVLVCCFVNITFAQYTQGTYQTPAKKVIDLFNNPATVVDAFNLLKDKPKGAIDGYIIKLPSSVGEGYVFDVESWKKCTPENFLQFEKDIVNLPKIKNVTENFLMIYGGCTLDWFNDEHWKLAEENIRYVATIAKKIGVKGICWDPESYRGHNPWKYASQPNYTEHTYKEYYDQVRKRGAQFSKILQEAFPGLTVLSLRELSDFAPGSAYSNKMLSLKAGVVDTYIKDDFSALRSGFINGNLDALLPGTKWVDANEDAYYYSSKFEFYQSVNTLKHDATMLIDPPNRIKYAGQWELGNAISSDYIGALWAKLKDYNFPAHLCAQAYKLTPLQRAQWFEHNSYYALKTAQEYVWVYDENMDWLRNKNMIEGFEAALISAKKKIEEKQPLGFEVEQMLIEAQQKAIKKTNKPIK